MSSSTVRRSRAVSAHAPVLVAAYRHLAGVEAHRVARDLVVGAQPDDVAVDVREVVVTRRQPGEVEDPADRGRGRADEVLVAHGEEGGATRRREQAAGDHLERGPPQRRLGGAGAVHQVGAGGLRAQHLLVHRVRDPAGIAHHPHAAHVEVVPTHQQRGVRRHLAGVDDQLGAGAVGGRPQHRGEVSREAVAVTAPGRRRTSHQQTGELTGTDDLVAAADLVVDLHGAPAPERGGADRPPEGAAAEGLAAGAQLVVAHRAVPQVDDLAEGGHPRDPAEGPLEQGRAAAARADDEQDPHPGVSRRHRASPRRRAGRAPRGSARCRPCGRSSPPRRRSGARPRG